jgi:hypothetical protein
MSEAMGETGERAAAAAAALSDGGSAGGGVPSSTDAGLDAGSAATGAAESPQGAEAPVAEPERKPGESRVEAAARRAEARLKSRETQQTDSSSGAAAQAGSDADSTPKAAADGAGAGDAGAEQAGDGAEGAGAGSIPGLEHWPAERRAALQALPQEAQQIVRGIAGDLQAGYTKATQTLSHLKRDLPGVAEAVTELGVAPDRLLSYARAGKLFEQNPEQALRALAEQAGVQVRFAGDPEPDAVPEFQSQQELAQWLDQQNARRLDQREREMQQRHAQAQQQQSLQAELAAAAQQYPDLDRKAVLRAIADSNGVLTAEQAYWLPRLGDITKENARLKAEHATLSAKLKKIEQQNEQRLKGLLDVPARREGRPANGADDGLTPIMRAAARAERRLAMR